MSVLVKFKRKIWRTGNTNVTSIPDPILNALGWKVGTQIHVYLDGNKVCIEKRVERGVFKAE